MRDIIITARGFKGWNELQAIRATVMKEEREGRYKALQFKNKMLDILGAVFAVLITGAGGAGLVYVAIKYAP